MSNNIDERLITIQDHQNLVKDGITNAVLNNDYDGFQAFKLRKEKEELVNNRLDSLDAKMNMILDAITTLTGKDNG